MNRTFTSGEAAFIWMTTSMVVVLMVYNFIYNIKMEYREKLLRERSQHLIERSNILANSEFEQKQLKSEIVEIRRNHEEEVRTLALQLEIQHAAAKEKEEELRNALYELSELNDALIYNVTASFYTASVDETDENPHITASGSKTTVGKTIAVSPDLYSQLKGKRVWIKGFGVRVVQDMTNPRFKGKIDILVGSKSEAMTLGVKKLKMVVLPT